ncbi:hypothetical protein, partial [Bacteroides caecimuris]|uniref:hypothetical protein n=1 Tax=Bacteroides caecimuris TaxID=1796613 RepID=UPI00263B2E54
IIHIFLFSMQIKTIKSNDVSFINRNWRLIVGNRQQIFIFALKIRKIGEKSNFLQEIVVA